MTYDPTPAGAPEPITPVAPAPQTVPSSPVVASPVSAPQAAGAKKKSGGGILNGVLVIAAAVALGGVAFAVGRGTAPVSAATGAGRGNQGVIVGPGGSFVPGNGQPGFGGRGGLGGGLTVSGEVVSIDGDTMTIKTASGQTIEVKTGDSTTYHTQTPATAADVQTGSKVQVQLEFNGNGQGGFARPGASGAPSGPAGTAGSVTVIP